MDQKNVKLCSSLTSCQQTDQCDAAGSCVELPVDDYVCQKAPAAIKTSTNQMAFNGHRLDFNFSLRKKEIYEKKRNL